MEQIANGIDYDNLFPTIDIGELREDEYADKEGLPYCKKCKTKRFYKWLNEDGTYKCLRVNCKCQQEEMEKAQEKELREKRIEAFNKRQELSLLGKKYLNARFTNAIRTEHNKEIYTKCENYVKKSKQCLENNIGLYIYGENSSGKSYLIACICNELVGQGYHCIYTSVPRMLAEIQQSFSNDTVMGQAQLTSLLEQQDFVFIDDLGKEFLGRESNQNSAKFAEKVLLEVLNARYNNGKPTIFSSNYSIGQIATLFGLDKAIIERINEMSTRVFKLTGDDFRAMALNEKSKIVEDLGI